MDEETPGSAARRVMAENLRLHQRVFELETKLQQFTSAADRSSTRIINVRKLLEQKDITLEQHATELEEKRAELQLRLEELKTRHELLHMWREILRIYQELFEQSPEARLMVSREGKVVLYNLKAEEMLGAKIRDSLHKPIEEMDFSPFDPGTAALVREALEKRRFLERSVAAGGRRITTSAFPVGTAEDLRGAMLKIAATREE